MTEWIRAINPTSPLDTDAEARTAARVSSLALFLGVVWGILGIVYMLTAGQEAMAAAVKQATADAPEAANAAVLIAQVTVVFSGLWVLVQLGLGVLQWVKPNIVIPIVFVILAALGLFWGVIGTLIATATNTAAAVPGWQLWTGLLLGVIQLIMHIAGIRGARRLRDLRAQAAYT